MPRDYRLQLDDILEAIGRIKDSASEIEWYKIIALRNILAHQYFGINVKILWDVITNKLDDLEKTCRKLI